MAKQYLLIFNRAIESLVQENSMKRWYQNIPAFLSYSNKIRNGSFPFAHSSPYGRLLVQSLGSVPGSAIWERVDHCMGASSSDGGSCSRMADASLDGARLAFSVVCRTKALAIIRRDSSMDSPSQLTSRSLMWIRACRLLASSIQFWVRNRSNGDSEDGIASEPNSS